MIIDMAGIAWKAVRKMGVSMACALITASLQ
jgi:hypothetical protein